MTIDLPLMVGMRAPFADFRMGVRAELVNVAPHIADSTFAIHRAILQYTTEMVWSVTHVESGLSVAYGKTKAKALANGVKVLRVETQKSVDAAVRKFARRAGGMDVVRYGRQGRA